MLRRVARSPQAAAGGCFALVASRYNARYVDSMLRAAKRCLADAGVKNVTVVRVPGAFEIPVVVARLARTHAPPLSAIVCLGVIIRGETAHAQLIGEAVTRSLSRLQVKHEIPIAHEVLLLDSHAQARARCLDPAHNRGFEAAQTALRMAAVMRSLNPP